MAVSEAVKKYVEQLAQASGASTEKATALLQVLDGDEKLQKALADELVAPRLRQDEFSRQMDSLKTEKDNLGKWYQGALTTYEQNKKAVEEATQRVNAYRQRLAEAGIDPDSQQGLESTRQAMGDYVSKKDLEQMLEKKDQQSIYLIKKVNQLSLDHFQKYGTQMDYDALQKIVVEKNLPLDAAYKELTEPLATKQSEATFAEKLKAAREEGLKEGLSQAHIPISTKPKEYHPIFDAEKVKSDPNTPKTERDRVAAFTDTWNKAVAESSHQ